jgi:hypothetical protein
LGERNIVMIMVDMDIKNWLMVGVHIIDKNLEGIDKWEKLLKI